MENYTELVFLLDRSGSMAGLEKDTVGGFNAMLKKQALQPGKILVTAVLFDHQRQVLYDRRELSQVRPMTEQDYWVRGSTALLDAVGETVRITRNHQARDPAERTIFVITTDGLENASTRYTRPQVRAMIEDCPESWEFLFLGANMDAGEQGGSLGIRQENTATCCNDSRGVALNYEAVGDAILEARCACAPISGGWKEKIDRDFRSRGK